MRKDNKNLKKKRNYDRIARENESLEQKAKRLSNKRSMAKNETKSHIQSRLLQKLLQS